MSYLFNYQKEMRTRKTSWT